MGQIDKQTDRWTDRETDKQTAKQTVAFSRIYSTNKILIFLCIIQWMFNYARKGGSYKEKKE
jgi:hypothetical protein